MRNTILCEIVVDVNEREKEVKHAIMEEMEESITSCSEARFRVIRVIQPCRLQHICTIMSLVIQNKVKTTTEPHTSAEHSKMLSDKCLKFNTANRLVTNSTLWQLRQYMLK